MMTRRDFLKTIGMGVVAAALPIQVIAEKGLVEEAKKIIATEGYVINNSSVYSYSFVSHGKHLMGSHFDPKEKKWIITRSWWVEDKPFYEAEWSDEQPSPFKLGEMAQKGIPAYAPA